MYRSIYLSSIYVSSIIYRVLSVYRSIVLSAYLSTPSIDIRV